NPDKAARQAALDAAEKDGSRVKPEFGSVFYSMSGPDKEHARIHVTIAVPGATAQSLGLPDNNKMGGVWIMNAGTRTAHLITPGSYAAAGGFSRKAEAKGRSQDPATRVVRG